MSIRNPSFALWRWPNGPSRGRQFEARTERQAGFSLIEVLVVLAIIGMVMGLVGPRVLGYLSDSKLKTARLQMQALSSSLDLFYLDCGHYPDTSAGLQQLVEKPVSADYWNGPYVKTGSVPLDPWGRPYVYRAPGPNGTAYEIISLGPTGTAGDPNNVHIK